MLIEKAVQPYIVYMDDSITSALQKINANQSRIVFAVNEGGVLLGSLSDGDFRRWITDQVTIDLNAPVIDAVNKNCASIAADAELVEIQRVFDGDISIVPLLDKNSRVVAIAKNAAEGISVGAKIISEDSPCFIISEIGNNHNGSIDLARRLVDLSVDAGVDCCKFQMRQMDKLYGGSAKQSSSADLGAEYTLDLLSRFQLSNDELFEMFDYCRAKGMTPMCTPWDKTSLQLLEEYGMEIYKVASADLTNHDLLADLADTGKPLICSTGMSTESEISDSVAFLRERAVQFVLLHCNSTYPTPFKDVHLNYIKRLKKISGGIVGYSGHERGFTVPVAAVAKGAKVVEKHFTVDKSMEGNDHKVSLLPDEMKMMVEGIRQVEEALGEGKDRVITQGEMMNREILAKSIYMNRDLSEGEVITRDMLVIRSPGQGLQPNSLEKVVGTVACRELRAGDALFPSDIANKAIQARDYKFRRPYGIPVRYHDYAELAGKSKMDFVEFHLSYRDMEFELEKFFSGEQAIGFAVHSPELFANDHIMDLCSSDTAYRDRSIQELQRVVDITRSLKAYFSTTEKPVIVINAGGHTKSRAMPAAEREALYKKVAESLARVDQQGVEIAIQTMPPFPWHFGGQSFHNLFMSADEMCKFHDAYGYRYCFDISHSRLACTYFKWDFEEFVRKLGPITAHLHIVDAEGVDGEGVQIGTGDVDFRRLGELLDETAPGVQFIPEVWQGHKNAGEGFWNALDVLEQYF